MTIGSTIVQTSGSTGNGVTTQFTFSFSVEAYGSVTQAEQIQVIQETIATGAETILTLTTHYTTSFNADQSSSPGGSITMVTAPSSAYRIWIRLNPSFLQATDYQNQGGFLMETVEDQADQQARQINVLADRIRRAPRVGIQAGTSFDGEITGDITPGRYVVINGTGTGYATVDGQSASGTSVLATGSITARLLADRFADEKIVNDYLTGTNWGAAFNAAIAQLGSAGGIIRLRPGSDVDLADAQVATGLANNIVFDFRGSKIRPRYTSGSAFKIGTGASQVQNIAVVGGWFLYDSAASGGPTQALFELRGARGFKTVGCLSTNLYQLAIWGNPADSQSAYKWHNIECEWNTRSNANGGHTDMIQADGSLGGYYEADTFIEGDAANIADVVSVLRLTSAQGPARFDHLSRNGGNWKGFDHGIRAVDARIVNVDLGAGSRIDDIQSVAFRVDVSSGASKGGCEAINLRGGFSGLGPGAISYVSNASASIGCSDINISEASNTNTTGYSIKFETTGSGTIRHAHVNGLNVDDCNPADANQDVVIIDGDVSFFSVDNVNVGNKAGASFTPRRCVYDNTAATKIGYIGDNIFGTFNSAVVYRANIGTTVGRHIWLRQDGTPSIVIPNHLSGMTLTNGTDATNDIDFAAGKCADSTNTVLISCAALTKQLDAAWAVGSAAGGLDGGSIANATYHCHAIQKDTTGVGDFIFSLSHDKSATCTMTIATPAVVTMTAHGLVAGSPIKFSTTGALPTGVTAGTQYYVISTGLTADAFQFSTSIGGAAVNTSGSQSGTHTCLPGPAMPSGYTHFRRIGSIIRSGGTILAFTQRGDEFLLKVPVAASDSASPGTSAITKVLTTPIGIQTDAIVTSGGVDATPAAATYGLVTALDQTDTAPTSALFNWAIAAAGAGVPADNWANLRVRTDTAASIRLRVDASTADLTLRTVTHGWVDTRGRSR